MGYYPLENQGRHGIVYAIPEDDDDENKTDWDFKTLKDIIIDQPVVSLRRRPKLAQALAKTILQLHTAGWLHKNLRSDTIIFLAPHGSSATLNFTHLLDTELEADLYRHLQASELDRETYQKRFD
ncbi:hypothetical protein N0V88_006788, partial [Collariella sp. IMI 366227]